MMIGILLMKILRIKGCLCTLMISVAICFPPPVFAVEDERNEKPYQFDFTYKGEIWSVADGGIKQDAVYIDNLDLQLSIDGKKAFDIESAKFFVYSIYNNDNTLSDQFVGDIQTVSNIDTIGAVRLLEAWYDQSFLDDNLSIRFGLYNLNAEFDVIDTATLFLNSSHGIGPEFSKSNTFGLSIFPVTSLAIRARYNVNDQLSFKAAILDGVPGDPNRPRAAAVIRLSNDEGILGVFETNYKLDEGMLRAGYWRNSSGFDDIFKVDINGNPLRNLTNSGFYLSAEHTIWKFGNGTGVSAFARFGQGEDNISRVGEYIGFGTVYEGNSIAEIPYKLGLAVAISENGTPFIQSQENQGLIFEKRETTIEATARFQVTDWLALQPDVQYVINPGILSNLKNALVFGLRFELSKSF